MKKFYFIAALIVLAFAIGPELKNFIHNDSAMASSSIAEAPIVDEIVVYTPSSVSQKNITVADIKKGAYLIEAIEVSPHQFVIDGARRFGRLLQFDTNHDGIIDETDHIFPHLSVGIIGPGKTISFVAWREAGLRSLILDPNHIVPEKRPGLPLGFWNEQNIVVLSDGSKWLTHHVPISTSFIDQLHTKDSTQQLVKPLR